MHDLVSGSLLEHSILVDTRFVGEGVLTDDGLVALHGDASDMGNQATARAQAARVDGRLQAVVISPRLDGHDHFFKSTVAGPFAQAVDGTFHLAGAFLQSR